MALSAWSDRASAPTGLRTPTCNNDDKTKHNKPTPFLLQAPTSPQPEQRTASIPVPRRLPSAALASPQLQKPIGHADTSKQGKDPSRYPTTASKCCSSSGPRERGSKTGCSAAPLSQGQREGEPSPTLP